MEFDKIESDYKSAIQLDPDNAEFHKSLASFLVDTPIIEDRDKQLALLHAQWAVRLKPDDPSCHTMLARVYLELRRYDDVRRECDVAQRLNPRFVEMFFMRFRLSRRLRDPESAIDYLLQALEIAPENAMLYHNLGSIYRSQGKYEEAVAEGDQSDFPGQENQRRVAPHKIRVDLRPQGRGIS